LLVGLSTAKALAAAAGLPLVGIHHIEGHILANALHRPLVLPAAVLIVSGGHTEVILMTDEGRYDRLGGTVDDAAGEAFDKTAKLLGLPYPGGPYVDELARAGQPERFRFPRPLHNDPRIVFSFSGLKTAVRQTVEKLPSPLDEQTVADVCHAAQQAIVDTLCQRLFQAAAEHQLRSVYLAGGVAANSELRRRVAAEAADRRLHFEPPEPVYCTDNAAMIAYAGWRHFHHGHRHDLALDSFARGALTSWR
jgi:N6-L-threonylcarbamoyladenine synthase